MKTAASYLCGRYEETYGQKIDEMKLHKLMYFAQRESLIRTGEPLFDAEFQGWRFGPVLPALREVYKASDFAPLRSWSWARIRPRWTPCSTSTPRRIPGT
jgi:uncharacterized phage-associated protein